MAKIKFGGLVVDARNSVGGSVFTKCKQGAVLRTNTAQNKVDVSLRNANRSRFRQLQTGFKSLTQTQILNWNTLAKSIQTTDIYGDLRTQSGLQLYTSLNYWRLLQSLTPNATPPALVSMAGLVSLTGVYTISGATFTITNTVLGSTTNIRLFIYASRFVSKGVSYPAKSYTRLQGQLVNQTSSNLFTDYQAIWGNPPVGSVVWVKARVVNISTGQAGPIAYLRIVVST